MTSTLGHRGGILGLRNDVEECSRGFASAAESSFQPRKVGANEPTYMIALAVAVTLRCDGCINAHKDAALKAVETEEKVVDALGVAHYGHRRAAMVFSVRTIDRYNAKAE